MQSHYAVIKSSNDNPEMHPMKDWVRKNPELEITGGTSHQMRAALQKKGWILVSQPNRVLVIQPDENGEITYARSLREESDEIEITDSEEAVTEIEEAHEITFGLERDLQLALRQNIEQLESGLKITDGGKERTTEVGRIDITASDEKDTIVVIELKAGIASPSVIAQILAYMSAVADTDEKTVRGILVAKGFHKQVIFAAKSIPNLELKKYSFQFNFESVHAG